MSYDTLKQEKKNIFIVFICRIIIKWYVLWNCKNISLFRKVK